MNVVTTFAPRAWNVYGARFVDSFLRHWPASIRLHVFLEGQPQPFQDEARITWHDLKDDPEHETFCLDNAHKDHPHDWNMMPVKFGHKVFAITSPKLPDKGWRVWIDADTETVAPVTSEWLDRVFPVGKALTYLGRSGQMRPGQELYTECGFVGYNCGNPKVERMLAEMRQTFVSEKVFTLGNYNWHDSYVFDFCRKEADFHPDRMHNLSAHLPPMTTDVWPRTVLAETMVHRKGPRRKLAAYGDIA